jgi:hypothetical protein
MWLKFELVRLLLVWHIFETCRVTLTVYWFFGYLTMIFNWLESNVGNRLNELWKKLLVHFSQIFFLKRLRKTAIVTQQVFGHDLNSGIRSMNWC